MAQYRSYFLNAASRIIGSAHFSAVDIAAARGEARHLLIDHAYRVAAELWRGDEYLGCVTRRDPETDEPLSAARPAKCPLLKKAS